MNLSTTLPELFVQYTISHDSQVNNKCTCITIMYNSCESVYSAASNTCDAPVSPILKRLKR